MAFGLDVASSSLAALVALAAALVRARAMLLCRAHALTRVPLLPVGPESVRVVLLAALATGAALVRPSQPSAGLALLGLCALLAIDLRLERGAPRGQRWRLAHAVDHQRARRAKRLRWLGPWSWLDATTPCGLALLGSGFAFAWLSRGPARDAALEGSLLLTALFVAAARTRLPTTAEVALPLLATVQARAVVRGEHTGELTVLVDDRDRVVDARWRVRRQSTLSGLVDLELVVIDARWLDRNRRTTAWLARAVAGSPADLALRGALPHARRLAQGDLVAHLAHAPAPDHDLAALHGWLAQRSATSTPVANAA